MYYTTGQVIKLLNISKPTLYKICKSKKINPQRTTGGNYRFSEYDLKQLLNENVDSINIEQYFVKTVNDIWLILKKLAEEIWGLKDGEEKLKEILKKNQNEIFILNVSNFKEM